MPGVLNTGGPPLRNQEVLGKIDFLRAVSLELDLLNLRCYRTSRRQLKLYYRSSEKRLNRSLDLRENEVCRRTRLEMRGLQVSLRVQLCLLRRGE